MDIEVIRQILSIAKDGDNVVIAKNAKKYFYAEGFSEIFIKKSFFDGLLTTKQELIEFNPVKKDHTCDYFCIVPYNKGGGVYYAMIGFWIKEGHLAVGHCSPCSAEVKFYKTRIDEYKKKIRELYL